MPSYIKISEIKKTVELALNEDIGGRCLSTAILPDNPIVKAKIIAREASLLCGQAWASQCFLQLDESIILDWHYQDGDELSANDVIVSITGPIKALLIAERSALNFLQTLSGTATSTRAFVDKIKHSQAKLLDTRKTIPGLRLAQKYATFIGGAINHRLGLYDAFLIKENHLKAFGGVKDAITRARNFDSNAFIEVEVESTQELEEALAAKPDRIMLDNFSLAMTKSAVALNQKTRVPLEFSGNVSLESISEIADTGVDYISVGAITKHINAVDLSLLIMA